MTTIEKYRNIQTAMLKTEIVKKFWLVCLFEKWALEKVFPLRKLNENRC